MKEWLDKYLGERFRDSVFKNEGIVLPVDRRFDTKTREIGIEKSDYDYVVYFCFPFDNDLISALELENRAVPYDGIYFRPGKAKCREILDVTYEDLSKLINELPLKERAEFIRWASEEARKAYEEERRKKLEATVASLSKLKIHTLTREATCKEYLHLLYTFNYTQKDRKFCWDAYNHDYVKEDFPGNPDYIANNRAFYILNENRYFVVSKNNYDTFWASQGNGFESCFSLTSQHGYIRGVPFWIAHKGFYMCYVTDGDITKWSAIPGHKCKLPKMTDRAWGYLRPDGSLALGKTYNKSGDRGTFWKDADIRRVFGNVKPEESFRVDTDYEISSYSVYYDNLRYDHLVSMSGTGGEGRNGLDRSTFYNKLQDLKFNDNIEFWDAFTYSDGEIVQKFLLPKSKLEKNPINEIIEATLEKPTAVRVVVNCSYQSESQRLVVYSEGYDDEHQRITFYVKYSTSGISIKKENCDERFIATVQH